MGILISNLSYKNSYKKIQINFENPTPSDKVRPVIESTNNLIECCERIKKEIDSYKSCIDEIREALENPEDSKKVNSAAQTIKKNVVVAKNIFDLSTRVNELFLLHLDTFAKLRKSNNSNKPIFVYLLIIINI